MVLEFIMQYGIFGLLLLKVWFYLIKSNTMENRMLGFMLLLNFIPLMIIDDTYLTRSFFWLWLCFQCSCVYKLEY